MTIILEILAYFWVKISNFDGEFYIIFIKWTYNVFSDENIYVFISIDSIVDYIGIVRVYLNLLMYINKLIAVNIRPKNLIFCH